MRRVSLQWFVRALSCGVWVMVVMGMTRFAAARQPEAPESPLKKMVGQLAAKRPAPVTDRQQLLRPEFRFKPAAKWLLLPELADSLGSTPEERAAVLQVLDAGAREANRLLAAQGADNDVAAATALFMSQLWQMARQVELPEAHTDALHAQIAAALAGPDLAKMPDADKQRYWEFCIGYPVFLAGLSEVVENDAQRQDLRKAAALGFESLIGVSTNNVDIGAGGLTVRGAAPKPAAPAVRSDPAPARHGAAGAVAGIDYTAPAGWSREDASWATIFRATLADVDDQGKPRPDNERQHAGSIFVLPPRTVGPDRAAAFEKIWREQFDTFDLGDTVAHYRSRLASKLVVHYMGRFFQRKNAGERDPRIYGVLYLVDLGGDKVQPVTATVVVGRAPLSMEMFNENEAFKALSVPLGAFLDSIKPRGGAAPYPAGGYFSPSDFVGNWKQSSSAFGGFYVNAQTGAAAGAAVHSAGGHLNLTADGKYDYAFGFASHNPQFGTTSGAEAHAGTYKLDGDILITEASKPVRHPLKRCAVGIGVRQTPGGPRRLLILVGANSEGVFRAQHLIPNWEYYPGVMDWYMEE